MGQPSYAHYVLTTSLGLAEDHTSPDSGGILALAAVNSVWWRRSDEPIDKMTGYDRLVEIVTAAHPALDHVELLTQAARRPTAAAEALARTWALRENVFVVLSDVVEGVEPDLDTLNDALAEAATHIRLAADGSGALRTTWDDPNDLHRPRWQIATSAVALLTGEWRDRLKQCPGEKCGWVFLDLTRNRSKRWCDPAECGNRERVRAHYRRTHAG